jgi:hypothetical protein
MTSVKLPDWLRDVLTFGQTPERDHTAGIVDGDLDSRQREVRAKRPATMQLTLVLEFERGKNAALTKCRVTRSEFRRFFAELGNTRAEQSEATVFIYPAAINGVEQERIGVPIRRLVRVQRADGVDIWHRQQIERFSPDDM